MVKEHDTARELDLEARRIEADLEIRRAELEEKRAQRESDRQRFERDVELRRHELDITAGSGIRFTTGQATVAAAILALVSAGIGGAIQAWSARDVEASKSAALVEIERVKADANIALEKQKQNAEERLDRAKFETTLILKATEPPNRDEQIRNLKFFLNAGFIGDPNNKIANMQESEFPTSASTTGWTAPSYLARFSDPVYYLIKAVNWKPKSNSKYPSIDVPVGFVVTFDSIPRTMWLMLRPYGDYASAFIIHDYLYWTQTTSRADADEIFKLALLELPGQSEIAETLYQAAKNFGQAAWDQNAMLKLSGEKRIMKVCPIDPNTRWEDWKKRSDVFSD